MLQQDVSCDRRALIKNTSCPGLQGLGSGFSSPEAGDQAWDGMHTGDISSTSLLNAQSGYGMLGRLQGSCASPWPSLLTNIPCGKLGHCLWLLRKELT